MRKDQIVRLKIVYYLKQTLGCSNRTRLIRNTKLLRLLFSFIVTVILPLICFFLGIILHSKINLTVQVNFIAFNRTKPIWLSKTAKQFVPILTRQFGFENRIFYRIKRTFFCTHMMYQPSNVITIYLLVGKAKNGQWPKNKPNLILAKAFMRKPCVTDLLQPLASLKKKFFKYIFYNEFVCL